MTTTKRKSPEKDELLQNIATWADKLDDNRLDSRYMSPDNIILLALAEEILKLRKTIAGRKGLNGAS